MCLCCKFREERSSPRAHGTVKQRVGYVVKEYPCGVRLAGRKQRSLEPQMCDVQWWLQKEEMAMSLVGTGSGL